LTTVFPSQIDFNRVVLGTGFGAQDKSPVGGGGSVFLRDYFRGDFTVHRVRTSFLVPALKSLSPLLSMIRVSALALPASVEHFGAMEN
jgi:hypothetical protein